MIKKLIKHLGIALKGEVADFTVGNINKALFYLSVPMVLEMVMESLFLIVDVFWVAKLGTNAVATIGITESILMLMESIAIGLAMAITAIVARRIGEKDKEGAARSGIQGIFIGILASTIIAIVGFIYAKEILTLMGGEPELVIEGFKYTRTMLGFNITLMMIFLLNAVFRGAGDAKWAMYTLWIANIINIILDPMLIFGWGPFPELGLEGAAIATNIGRGAGVVFQLFILLNGMSLIRVGKRHLKLKWETISSILNIGATGCLQFLIGTASWIFMVRLISEFGSPALSGYTIAIRIIVFTILPSWGLANAAATLVGQNLGAKKPDRAETSVWRAAFANMLFLAIIGLIFFIFAKEFIQIFDTNPEVVKNGVMALRIICLGYVFYAFGMVIAQSFNGAGDTLTPTIINFACFWMLQIPLAWFLSQKLEMGPAGVYWAISICNSILAVLMIIFFRRGKWKQVSI